MTIRARDRIVGEENIS